MSKRVAHHCGIISLLILMAWPQLLSAAVPTVQVKRVSGLEIWLSEYYALPIIELQLVFQGAGTISDPQGKQGRAALAAALLKEGAGNRTSAAFTRALEENAIDLSVDLGRDTLTVSLKTLAEHRQTAFELLADMLRFAHFDVAAIDKVKRQMRVQREQQQESPMYLAQRAYEQTAYAGHPYAQDALGSDESVEALTQADLQEYLSRYLAKDVMLVSVAGAITAKESARLISGYLGELPASARPEQKIAPITVDIAPFEQTIEQQLPQSLLMFARPSLPRSDPQFYAAFVLNHILGGGALTSRLGHELREKQGLTYGVSSWLEVSPYANRWAGVITTQNATVAKSKEAIRAVLTQLAAEGVTADELRAAKDYITSSYPLQIDSNFGVVSFLTQMQLHGLGADYFSKRNDYFDAVTIEQVNASAALWLKEADWSWVTVGGSDASNVTEESATP